MPFDQQTLKAKLTEKVASNDLISEKEWLQKCKCSAGNEYATHHAFYFVLQICLALEETGSSVNI